MDDAAPPLRLVVGLGNPGPQYGLTRHNAGFWLVDELARRHGVGLRFDARYDAEVGALTAAAGSLWLLKPMTFMNRCGPSVARLAGFYKIPPPQILVVHDDLDLPPGTVRLKRAGGHGGHNGLRDIIRCLGGNDFLRLRLGIGHPGDAREVVGYVLRRAPADEQQRIEAAVDDALREFPRLLEGRLENVMHALHSRRPP
ncbi:MAG: aminoacyl-tRNA hydrolase [Pseudomonadota bacterium]|nr:aminoacyl-tRNA hydrolase [Pseudomonadota bacterium]